ncbi:MAG: hypothetical protein ACOX6Y_03525 [Christensenellales bacterium]|jgi:hypothetical protein
MSNFKIIVKLDRSVVPTSFPLSVVYSELKGKKFKDDIKSENNSIILTGSRSKKISQKGILETAKSTYYDLLIKSLIFFYYRDKQSFKVIKVTSKNSSKPG